MPIRRIWILLIGLAITLLAVLSAFISAPKLEVPRALAAENNLSLKKEANQQATGGDENLSIEDETCLSCHGQPGPTLTLGNGEVLDLYVSEDDYAHSIHGEKGYACVQCHTEVGNYPHPPFQAASVRDASRKLYTACQYCHSYQYEKALDSVHETALTSGIEAAAICTDCHTAHTVRQLNDPDTHKLLPSSRSWIPQTCAKCHNAIYQKYQESVHGAALLDESNPDVPTCIDCHGVHNIENPTTATFRLRSPQICAECHTDEALMSRYGISTDVVDTYVADFHGTTVTIFEKQTPDAETNKAVCYDCHGIHDISRPDDPVRGIQSRKENLLARCQACHPYAEANFPTAWMSHYNPSPDQYPIVYYVDLFYKVMIPGVLGGMGVLVVLDMGRSVYNRTRKRGSESLPVSPSTSPGQTPLAGDSGEHEKEEKND